MSNSKKYGITSSPQIGNEIANAIGQERSPEINNKYQLKFLNSPHKSFQRTPMRAHSNLATQNQKENLAKEQVSIKYIDSQNIILYESPHQMRMEAKNNSHRPEQLHSSRHSSISSRSEIKYHHATIIRVNDYNQKYQVNIVEKNRIDPIQYEFPERIIQNQQIPLPTEPGEVSNIVVDCQLITPKQQPNNMALDTQVTTLLKQQERNEALQPRESEINSNLEQCTIEQNKEYKPIDFSVFWNGLMESKFSQQFQHYLKKTQPTELDVDEELPKVQNKLVTIGDQEILPIIQEGQKYKMQKYKPHMDQIEQEYENKSSEIKSSLTLQELSKIQYRRHSNSGALQFIEEEQPSENKIQAISILNPSLNSQENMSNIYSMRTQFTKQIHVADPNIRYSPIYDDSQCKVLEDLLKGKTSVPIKKIIIKRHNTQINNKQQLQIQQQVKLSPELPKSNNIQMPKQVKIVYLSRKPDTKKQDFVSSNSTIKRSLGIDVINNPAYVKSIEKIASPDISKLNATLKSLQKPIKVPTPQSKSKVVTFNLKQTKTNPDKQNRINNSQQICSKPIKSTIQLNNPNKQNELPKVQVPIKYSKTIESVVVFKTQNEVLTSKVYESPAKMLRQSKFMTEFSGHKSRNVSHKKQSSSRKRGLTLWNQHLSDFKRSRKQSRQRSPNLAATQNLFGFNPKEEHVGRQNNLKSRNVSQKKQLSSRKRGLTLWNQNLSDFKKSRRQSKQRSPNLADAQNIFGFNPKEQHVGRQNCQKQYAQTGSKVTNQILLSGYKGRNMSQASIKFCQGWQREYFHKQQSTGNLQNSIQLKEILVDHNQLKKSSLDSVRQTSKGIECTMRSRKGLKISCEVRHHKYQTKGLKRTLI